MTENNEGHGVWADGTCMCCGSRRQVTTGGCTACNSQRMYCSCGVLVHCGCGRKFEHRCSTDQAGWVGRWILFGGAS